jgi:hypothetical protein
VSKLSGHSVFEKVILQRRSGLDLPSGDSTNQGRKFQKSRCEKSSFEFSHGLGHNRTPQQTAPLFDGVAGEREQ